MKLSNLFITGCDSNTEWMLPWFVENFKKHNPNANLVIYDFGMEGGWFPELRKSLRESGGNGWFKKPLAMLKATNLAENICWIDTDCEILANIEDIFDYVIPNKLSMGVDYPWTARSGEEWHNTGVVAFTGIPPVLTEWNRFVLEEKHRGDQETLHWMMGNDPLRRLIHIDTLPQQYNTLRLDILDGTTPSNIKIMHWTGSKGKEKIKELMNG